jgi:isopentenyldiphosphate isomerase
MDSIEEFDLVDRNDNVIGSTDKVTAHSKKQLHRVAAVYVFNEKGELYVQVHWDRGLYDHSVGGHVSKGEAYEVGAAREAQEELGITQPLKKLSVFYSDEGSYLHMFGLFTCVAEPSWKFVPNEEVGKIIPMKLEDIEKLMETNREKFTGGFINTMKEYRRIIA